MKVENSNNFGKVFQKTKDWNKNKPEKVKLQRKKFKIRNEKPLKFKFADNLRHRINQAFKSQSV